MKLHKLLYDAVFAMAASHGHDWAGFAADLPLHEYNSNPYLRQSDSPIQYLDWDELSNEITRKMDEYYSQDDRSMQGLGPDLTHSTGTGRLSWSTTKDVLCLQVHRPGRIGSITVLEARYFIERHVSPAQLAITSLVIDSDQCHLRHWTTFAECYATIYGCDWAGITPAQRLDSHMTTFESLPIEFRGNRSKEQMQLDLDVELQSELALLAASVRSIK